MATTGQQPLEGNAERNEKLRRRFRRFRILILGRANAGKTTILQKVCNTSEQPEIFDANGHKIDSQVVTPSQSRGIHDIENEMVFKSNPGFVFHDSRGFEAGGDYELGIVKDFIAQRAREKRLNNQLHAIWYCIPVDNSRPITSAEHTFFSECGTGRVPVIVVFTKLDALDIKAWRELCRSMPREQAKEHAPQHSLSIVKSQYWGELDRMQYPPKGKTSLRDMNKESTDCSELIQKTVSALDDSNLQLLLVSTQQVNLEICIKYAHQYCLMPKIFESLSTKGKLTEMRNKSQKVTLENQRLILECFPHFKFFVDRRGRFDGDVDVVVVGRDVIDVDFFVGVGRDVVDRDGFVRDLIDPSLLTFQNIQLCIHSLIGGPPLPQQITCLGIALILISEHSYFLWKEQPSNSSEYFIASMNIYKDSTNFVTIIKAVDDAFKECSYSRFSLWDTQARKDAKINLTGRILKIIMDNRLSKDFLNEQLKTARLINKRDWVN